MSNSVDPDETAHYEPSYLDLRCLHKSVLSLMAVKELGCPKIILFFIVNNFKLKKKIRNRLSP